MIETKSHQFSDNMIFAQRWLKLFVAVIVVFALSACEDNPDEPETHGAGFDFHIANRSGQR